MKLGAPKEADKVRSLAFLQWPDQRACDAGGSSKVRNLTHYVTDPNRRNPLKKRQCN